MAGIGLKQLQTEWENSPETDAFYPLACAYLESGLYEAAADVLQQGLRHHPRHSRALAALGQVLFRRQEIDEARAALERALSFDSTCSSALCTLAEIEIEAGNFQRADNWLCRAESAAASSGVPAGAPGGTLNVADLRHQLKRKRCSYNADPAEIPFVTETMVELYLQQGMQEKAVAALGQLVIRNPEDAALRRRFEELRVCMQRPLSDSGVQEQLGAWLRAIEQQKLERPGSQRRE